MAELHDDKAAHLSDPQRRLLEVIFHWPSDRGYVVGDRRKAARTAAVLLRLGLIEEVDMTARSSSYKATDAGRAALGGQ